jgi:ribosomal protein S18 acetylase RimI-like enzyme
MTRLVPMRTDAYPRFLDEAVTGYAEDNVVAGRWPPDEALELSRAEFARLLPAGLETADHRIYEIEDEASGQLVGFVWLAFMPKGTMKSAYVYQVVVQAEFRRLGHARAALQALEAIAAFEGASNIGLHVFQHNPGAQALYEALGYRVNSVNMLKPLASAESGNTVPGSY